FFSSRRRHTRSDRDWSSDVCSSDLMRPPITSFSAPVIPAARPSILLLDEPAAGMTGAEKDVIGGLIRSIRDRGVTVLLVEHDMRSEERRVGKEGRGRQWRDQ